MRDAACAENDCRLHHLGFKAGCAVRPFHEGRCRKRIPAAIPLKITLMTTDADNQRMKLIKTMLFEMAAGNFSFKIKRSETDDELEGLCVLVNMLAEELQMAVFHSGYINPRQHYQFFVQSTIVLDADTRIVSFNQHTPSVLGVPDEFIYNRLFGEILAPASAMLWQEISLKLREDEHFHHNMPLQFISDERLPAPWFCTISRLLHSSKIVISSVTMAIAPDSMAETEREARGLFSADARRMQELYDYILAHLEEPLPTLQELSRIFGTNEVKLKEGFRYFFKTSIYQFYNDERLKRARLLVEQTDLTLKTISHSCGFGSYPNFSKAFSKKFGCAPATLRAKR
ncbi:MAG: AraC family transcriptional regulator [Sphingobacteriales bacterium]|nr:MAG: AraC family transcriptional regulator [Sphingobacteriales bacterium]